MLPNIQRVCEHLDIEILHDIEEIHGEENNPKVYPVVSLGQKAELGAGLRGCQVTPWFRDEAELDAFCGRHLNRFLAVGEDDRVPDARMWDERPS